MKTRPIAEYAESLADEYVFDDLIQEQHFNGTFSADPYLRIVLDRASQYCIELTGMNEFDHEAFFRGLFDAVVLCVLKTYKRPNPTWPTGEDSA